MDAWLKLRGMLTKAKPPGQCKNVQGQFKLAVPIEGDCAANPHALVGRDASSHGLVKITPTPTHFGRDQRPTIGVVFQQGRPQRCRLVRV
jgi:hypothetical protein